MSAEQLTCPGCGAPLKREHRLTNTVVCPYSGQVCEIQLDGTRISRQGVRLAEFPSILAVGASLHIRGKSSQVLGRVRYVHDEGYWDEWLVSLENASLQWLQEDEGEFTLFVKQTLTSPIPPFEQIAVGSTLSLGALNLFVTEKGQAFVQGGEGELNFKLRPGEEMRYVDGNAAGQVVSIEMLTDEIAVYAGQPLALSDLTVLQR